MKLDRKLAQTTAILIIVGACNAGHADPTPFRAVYRADYRGLPVSATGIRELRREEDGSYVFTSSAKSFFASVSEQSLFQWNGRAVPLEYRYKRTGIGKNRDERVVFDWQLGTASHANKSFGIADGTLDKLLYQLQMREDLMAAHTDGQPWPEMHYEIADRRRVRTFDFSVTGTETLSTPLGEFSTIKAIRVRRDQDRKTTLWLAPRFDFLLVRLQQVEGGGKGFKLLLKEAEFNGEPLKGM